MPALHSPSLEFSSMYDLYVNRNGKFMYTSMYIHVHKKLKIEKHVIKKSVSSVKQ